MWARVFAFALLIGAVACTNQSEDDETGVESVGPELSHTVPEGVVREGDSLTLTVNATDEEGVVGVTLYYRTAGLSAWEVAYMEAGEGDAWSASLEGNDIAAPGLEYYFKGIDDSNFQALTLLPEAGPSGPYVIDIQVIGQSLPFLEDFEGASNGLLKELGWKATPQGFEGYEFELTQSDSWSPTTGIWHRRGPDGLAPFKDWLISPPLDFSDTAEVQVTFWERVRYAEETNHSLWVSTTTSDVSEEGAFQKVADLATPGEEWSRSDLIDLSAFGGEQVVYLAWYYEGQNADDWYIDDVDVRALQPDLRLANVAWTPVDPGGQSTVTLTLENQSPMAAADLSVSMIIDAAAGSADGPHTVSTVETGGEVDVVFTVDVAVDHRDNAYLPFTVAVTDGTSDWSFDSRLVVGDTTTVDLEFYLFGTAYVTGWLGVGDVDAPDLYVVAFNDVFTGEEYHNLQIDVTEHAEFLPATAADRWWLKIESAEWGMVERFDLNTGGVLESATVPHFFYENFPEWIFVPEPPNPMVDGSNTSPATLAPGDSGTLTVILTNYGEPTQGSTSVTLSSSDPSIQFTSGTTQEVASSGWARNQTYNLTAGFDIAADKKDSVPISVDVQIVDEVESFERTTSVSVPWPVLEVTRILIDDATGDNDGVLDPSESAELEIYVSNTGGKNTFAMVNCTLSQTGGVATASLTGSSANYGVLSVGETEDKDGFDVEVTSGALNDDLQFGLSCTDGTETYETGFTLELGVPPWNAVSTTRDSGADAVGGYGFDLLSGRYRSDGTTLDIALTSATEFNTATVFVEAWAKSVGSDYTWYQFVVQGGSVKVRGYDGKFHDLSTPTVTFPSTTEVIISVDIASLGLLQDVVTIGFASGFCGGSDYYCDHYPDGWGDPYNAGFYTSEWFDLSW